MRRWNGKLLAAGTALLTLAAANLWVGVRLPYLLAETSIGELSELERRVAAFPRERVRVLVLGNSEAIAGLRPPFLTEALGLGRDGVFSLALVGASPHEMRLVLERLLPAFPQVRTVLCGVNESFLTAEHELRLRRLTAGRLDERLALARDKPLESQVRLVAGTWLPLLDFGTSLRQAVLARPRHTLKGLFIDVPRLVPSSAARYPWGLTPQWSLYSDRQLRYLRVVTKTPAHSQGRAARFLQHPGRIPAAVRQLGRLARTLRAAGPELVLVELPYTRGLAEAMRRRDPAAAAAWRAALDALPADERAPRLPAPPIPDAEFYDVDHLAPEGARRMAAAIARYGVIREARHPGPAGQAATPPSPR